MDKQTKPSSPPTILILSDNRGIRTSDKTSPPVGEIDRVNKQIGFYRLGFLPRLRIVSFNGSELGHSRLVANAINLIKASHPDIVIFGLAFSDPTQAGKPVVEWLADHSHHCHLGAFSQVDKFTTKDRYGIEPRGSLMLTVLEHNKPATLRTFLANCLGEEPAVRERSAAAASALIARP